MPLPGSATAPIRTMQSGTVPQTGALAGAAWTAAARRTNAAAAQVVVLMVGTCFRGLYGALCGRRPRSVSVHDVERPAELLPGLVVGREARGPVVGEVEHDRERVARLG